MVFQKETGTLVHMTEGANWLCTVERFYSCISTFQKITNFQVIEGELGVFTASKGSGGETAKICLSRRFLATAIEKHGPSSMMSCIFGKLQVCQLSAIIEFKQN